MTVCDQRDVVTNLTAHLLEERFPGSKIVRRLYLDFCNRNNRSMTEEWEVEQGKTNNNRGFKRGDKICIFPGEDIYLRHRYLGYWHVATFSFYYDFDMEQSKS